MKTRIDTTIDVELKQKAQDMGINLSELMEIAIREKLKDNTVALEEFENLEKWLGEIIANANIAHIELKERIEKLKIEELTKKIESLPEIQNLTSENLEDSGFMMNLIDLLRKKYPETRISITDIKEFYKPINP